jgi:hypothetical protein
VYTNTPSKIEKLKDAIRQETEAVNFDALGIVFQNLEKRIQVCLEVEGEIFSIDYKQVLFFIVPGMRI